MPYKLTIQNSDGVALRGIVYFFDGPNEIGQAVVYPGGVDLDAQLVADSTKVLVTAEGYSSYGLSSWQLGDTNTITLNATPPVMLYAAVGLVAGYLISKYL